jgi:hypothetical protein
MLVPELGHRAPTGVPYHYIQDQEILPVAHTCDSHVLSTVYHPARMLLMCLGLAACTNASAKLPLVSRTEVSVSVPGADDWRAPVRTPWLDRKALPAEPQPMEIRGLPPKHMMVVDGASGHIRAVDDADTLTFVGQAGQLLLVRIQALSDRARFLTLTVPNLDDRSVLFARGPGLKAADDAFDGFVVRQTGRHQLIVRSDRVNFGRYRLWLYAPNSAPEKAGERIVLGTPKEGEAIDYVGDVDHFTFDMVKGEKIEVIVEDLEPRPRAARNGLAVSLGQVNDGFRPLNVRYGDPAILRRTEFTPYESGRLTVQVRQAEDGVHPDWRPVPYRILVKKWKPQPSDS